MNIIEEPYEQQLTQTSEPTHCHFCRQYLPRNSVVRTFKEMTFCTEHPQNSVSTGSEAPYSYGNFQLQFGAEGFEISFDPNVAIQQAAGSAVVARTPIVMLSTKRIFQLEVFHVQEAADATQGPAFFGLAEAEGRITLTVDGFQEPQDVRVLTNEQQMQLQQNPPTFEYITRPCISNQSQMQMNPRYCIYKQTDPKLGYRYKYLQIHLVLSHPPSNCKQFYYQYSVNYVLRADVAKEFLQSQYPRNDYITQEFSYIMFKPFYRQCCRVVQFDKDGQPLHCVSDAAQRSADEAREQEIIAEKVVQITKLIDQQNVEQRQLEELRQEDMRRQETRQRGMQDSGAQAPYRPLPNVVRSVDDITDQKGQNHFSVHLNDSLIILNKRLDPSKVLVYGYSLIEGDRIASAKRSERQTACYLRNYIIMNEFMARYCWFRIGQQDTAHQDALLLIPTQPVAAKLVTEVYSKFAKLDKTKTISWDFEDNFLNFYCRLYDADGHRISDYLEQLNRMNKQAELRSERRLNKRLVKSPYSLMTLGMIDMDQFYQQIGRQIKQGRIRDDETKVFGTDKILLEPLYQNTYLSGRLSFPYFKFTSQNCQFLGQSEGEQLRKGDSSIQTARDTLNSRAGQEYHFQQIDELADAVYDGQAPVLDLNEYSDYDDVHRNITTAEADEIARFFEAAAAVKGVRPYYNYNYRDHILGTKQICFLHTEAENLVPSEYHVQSVLKGYPDVDTKVIFEICKQNHQMLLGANILRESKYEEMELDDESLDKVPLGEARERGTAENVEEKKSPQKAKLKKEEPAQRRERKNTTTRPKAAQRVQEQSEYTYSTTDTTDDSDYSSLYTEYSDE